MLNLNHDNMLQDRTGSAGYSHLVWGAITLIVIVYSYVLATMLPFFSELVRFVTYRKKWFPCAVLIFFVQCVDLGTGVVVLAGCTVRYICGCTPASAAICAGGKP